MVYWHKTDKRRNIIYDLNGRLIAYTGELGPLEEYDAYEMQLVQFEVSILKPYLESLRNK